jgi:hypothetical protein
MAMGDLRCRALDRHPSASWDPAFAVKAQKAGFQLALE